MGILGRILRRILGGLGDSWGESLRSLGGKTEDCLS